jgi:hypothetical protein
MRCAPPKPHVGLFGGKIVKKIPYIKSGEIIVCRLGARILIPRAELEAFLERKKQS